MTTLRAHAGSFRIPDFHVPIAPIALSSPLGPPPIYHFKCDNWGAPKFEIDLEYLGRFCRYRGDLRRECGGPRGQLIPPSSLRHFW